LSLKTFANHERGVLISYLLFGKCAGHLFKESEMDHHGKFPIDDEIEENL